MDIYQEFIHQSRYARYLDAEGRRESWPETVDRYIDFMKARAPLDNETYEELRTGILNMEVMPSMRAMMTAGPALDRCNVAGFNCSYVAVDHPRVFDEILYILMCGTGVGFSVERQEITKLPPVSETFEKTDTVLVVEDSKEGWAKALRELLAMLWVGRIPSWDVSKVRPAGARLKTFGGRASGPGPLVDLFNFSVRLFQKAAGRKLTSIECHDLVCKVAEIVVVGGVRRCLPADTPVWTPRGPKAIGTIGVGDEIITGGKTARVLAAAPSGVKKTLIIRHRFGELECTPEHRVAVFNSIMKYEFKRADEIREGDRLVWDSIGYEGDVKGLPHLMNEDLHFNSKDIRIPELTEEVAWLIGLFQGDGYVGGRSLEIAGNMKDIAILERAAHILEREFGVVASVGHDGRKGGVGARLRANSAPLARWFGAVIKQSNTPLAVPDFIMGGPITIRAAYLAGLLDADGRYNKKDGRIDQATTIYQGFAEDLVTLLAGLGVAAPCLKASAQKRRDNGERAQDFYTVRIVGNTNRRKYTELVRPLSYKLEKVTVNFDSPIDFSFPIRWAGSNQGYSPNGNINVSAMRYDLALLPTRVMAVEEGRNIETYDIEVENIAQFTANGLVVHNSALISLSNLSDDRMRDAKTGQWWETEPQRALANNSAVYTEKPDMATFIEEWTALYKSKSGERGIFNREASKKKVAENGRRDPGHDFGTNPCCVTGDTLVLTNIGEVAIRELVGRQVSIWNGEEFAEVTPYVTGEAELLELVFVAPSGKQVTLHCTHNHKFVKGGTFLKAQDLNLGDRLDVFRRPEGLDFEVVYHSDEPLELVKVMPRAPEQTYCFTEPKTHRGTFNGIVTGQSEIILRSAQFCNLSEVVCRENDTLVELKRKVRLATILGTIQSSLTDFKYLRKIWKRNTEEERLLGVSLTGIVDCRFLRECSQEDLTLLRDYAIWVNKQTAGKLNIPPSTAITCVKPSGTVSALTNSSSGIHARHSDYYIRTVRGDNKDPLSRFMADKGIPVEPDIMRPETTLVFSFPHKSPEGAVTRNQMTAIQQLEFWLKFQRGWCEHKPSVTISVREHEWLAVGAWVYEHFDEMSGISFLPHSEHIYQQAPYQECSREEYEALKSEVPQHIDWKELSNYEKEDNTKGAQTYACSAGVCEVVDLIA